MEFPEGTPDGHFCLKPLVTVGDCVEPFSPLINQASISGEQTTNSCGIEQNLPPAKLQLLLRMWTARFE